MPSVELRRLRALVGDTFLRYVLNVPVGVALDDLAPTERQRVVVKALSDLAAQSDEAGSAGPLNAYLRISRLSVRAPGEDVSWVNALRQFTGGDIEEAPLTGDHLINEIAEIASDVWPIYLIRPSVDGPRTSPTSSPIGVYQHPLFESVAERFLEDESLRRLFPFPPDGGSFVPTGGSVPVFRYQSVIIGGGSSGSIQLAALIPSIISDAVFRCLIRNEDLNLATLIPNITASILDLRRLAEGETVDLPALVGFAGARLLEGQTLEFPIGQLRAARGVDQDLFMPGAPALKTVLATVIPTRVYAVREHNFENEKDPLRDYSKFEVRITEMNRLFTRRLDAVRLSLILASPDDKPWLTREVARFVPNMLTHSGTLSWDPGFSYLPSYEIPAERLADIETWHRIVRDKDAASLEVGLRRLLSAMTMRIDPIDAFVDAVVCWENMFGVKTETTFRVTASIAKLLEPSDYAAREELQRTLKGLYEKRSRLVHGGSEPGAEELVRYRDRATGIAVDCFRVLYRDRPDLLGLPAERRGARVLLE